MAEKIINTRILLKYDTYANWTTNNPVLKPGEFAVATIATGNTQEVNSVTVPQVLIKVGDGTTAYNALPFVSAKAADVYSWAKADKKPTYTAEEITGLSDYIAGEIEDTDTQYTIVKVNDYQYKLQSRPKGDSAYSDTGVVIDIPKYDDTAVKKDISDLKTLVGTTAVATQIANAIAALNLANTYEPKGAAATEAGKVQTALGNYIDSNDGVIAAMKNGTAIDSFKDVEDALALKDQAIAEAKGAGEAAQEDVDALAEKVGSVTSGKTVVQMIEEAQEAATYDDADLKNRATAVEGKVTTLIGADENKSVRTIASEEIAAKLIAENADASLDSLEEIAKWIQDHPDDAAAMNAAIVALQNQLKGIAEGEGTVKKYVDDAIAALKIGDYAKAADLTALAGRVTTAEGKITTLEGKAHEHANKTTLDKVTEEKVAAWDKVSEKANDADLAAIAKTGSTDDLVQGSLTLIFNCGDSTNCGA